MENPCKTCIVRANCTEVCPDKENLKILLSSAVNNFRRARITTPQMKKQYKFYKNLQFENSMDIHKIVRRKFSLIFNDNPYP